MYQINTSSNIKFWAQSDPTTPTVPRPYRGVLKQKETRPSKQNPKTFEEDLAQDVLEIITVFSARLYGARSRKNRKILEDLKEAAKNL